MDVLVTPQTFGPEEEQKRKKGRPRLWSTGPHKLVDAWVVKVEGLDEELSACKSAEAIQKVIDSLHEVPRICWIMGNADEKTWELRVGPVILPVFNPIYVFSIEVEKRDSDKTKQNPWTWLSHVDPPDTDPRAVVAGSFKLSSVFVSPQVYQQRLQEGVVDAWKSHAVYGKRFIMDDPTFLFCAQAVHRFTRGVAHTAYAHVAASGGEKVMTPSTMLRYVNSEMRCTSLTEAELQRAGRVMSLAGRIDLALSLRELFLGADYFAMCRYFSSGDLVKLSPSVFRKLCENLPQHAELIFMTFMRHEGLGRRFVDGASLVRFLDERVVSGAVLDTLLPSHHATKVGSTWTAHAERLARKEEKRKEAEAAVLAMGIPSTPAPATPMPVKRPRKDSASRLSPSSSASSPLHQTAPKKRSTTDLGSLKQRSATSFMTEMQRHAPVGVIGDPNSKQDLANWFTTLRAVYYGLLGVDGLDRGSIYPRRFVLTTEERPYVQYLVDKDIVRLYSGFNARGPSPILRHLTNKDCGQLVENVMPGVLYTVHAFMQTKATFATVTEVVSMLTTGYRSSLASYTRINSKNFRFEAKTQTLTYEQEYVSLSKSYAMHVKINGGVLNEDLAEAHERLKVVSQRKRARLEPHEIAFLDGHRWPPHQRAAIEEDLLTRDAVPTEGTTAFWEGLSTLATGAFREFRYCDACRLMDRFEQIASTRLVAPAAKLPPSSELINEVRQLVRKALRYPIVVINMPEANVGERRPPGSNAADLFASVAREMADACFGPGEVPYAQFTTRDTLLFKRCDVFKTPSAKLVSLHEVEKWTPADLQEVLSACFFDWDGRDSWKAPVNSHVLWVWADRSAIDMGALSVLMETADIPAEAMLDLRSISVRESECAGLAATLLFKRDSLGDSYTNDTTDDDDLVIIDADGSSLTKAKPTADTDMPVIKERLTLTKASVDDVHFSLNDHVTDAKFFDGVAQAKQISMSDLPRIRLGVDRPNIGWVELSSLSSWREIYTLMCHVRCALILKGGIKSLDLLLDASTNDFCTKPVDKVWDPYACDVFIDPNDGLPKRLVFAPRGHLDIYTDLNNPIQPGPPQTVSC